MAINNESQSSPDQTPEQPRKKYSLLDRLFRRSPQEQPSPVSQMPSVNESPAPSQDRTAFSLTSREMSNMRIAAGTQQLIEEFWGEKTNIKLGLSIRDLYEAMTNPERRIIFHPTVEPTPAQVEEIFNAAYDRLAPPPTPTEDLDLPPVIPTRKY